jgi:Opioid growth factor receptor (OGFr) conserved region
MARPQSSEQMINFITKNWRDSKGNTYAKYLFFKDQDYIENERNFIQWLFPTRRASETHPSMATLDEHGIDEIRSSTFAQNNLIEMTNRMIRFYSESDVWLKHRSHHHKRISRIIESVGLLVGADAASSFLESIEEIAAAADDPIDPCAHEIWHERLREVGGRLDSWWDR